MNVTQWYAVRCCCKPQNVLGFIKLPALEHGRIDDILVPHHKGGHKIELFVRRFVEGGKSEFAISAQDRPLDWWRDVPGFVELIRQPIVRDRFPVPNCNYPECGKEATYLDFLGGVYRCAEHRAAERTLLQLLADKGAQQGEPR